MNKEQKTLDKVAKGLLNSKAAEHKKPKDPSKKELNKKFVMRVDRKGKASIKEVS
jgi:hypothetical protein